MNKKPVRKVQLSGETIRVLSKDQISKAAGGEPTESLTIGTTPFPSRGPCGLPI
jgi:hypothetical protein